MRKILLIGIGAGNPDYITIQAIKALNQADVVFLLDKGEDKRDLSDFRRSICERHIENRYYRVVEVESPKRDTSKTYLQGVHSWHREKSDIFTSLIANELAEDEVGAFLVWGDPSLYDSTLRIIDRILADSALSFEYQVIPGITSIQALAAEHKISLNPIGEPVQITTGRMLRENRPVPNSDNTVVMLDDGSGLSSIAEQDAEIFWGAYLGTPDQLLISGNLKNQAANILKARAEARARKGWIMDTYILRQPPKA
jgi:precorrin-6A synthase